MKDKIKNKHITLWFNCKNKNLVQPSLINCDYLEYIHNKDENYFDHHLMFYFRGKLVFKMWLPNENKDKPFRDVKEALKSVGVRLVK